MRRIGVDTERLLWEAVVRRDRVADGETPTTEAGELTDHGYFGEHFKNGAAVGTLIRHLFALSLSHSSIGLLVVG